MVVRSSRPVGRWQTGLMFGGWLLLFFSEFFGCVSMVRACFVDMCFDIRLEENGLLVG